MMTPEDAYEPLCSRLQSLAIRLHLVIEQLIELLDGRTMRDDFQRPRYCPTEDGAFDFYGFRLEGRNMRME